MKSPLLRGNPLRSAATGLMSGIALIACADSVAQQPPTDEVIDAIYMALDDEYHAEAMYDEVLAIYGDVSPFNNIVEAERRHAASMISLLEKYDQPVPANPYASGEKPFEPIPSTLRETCQAGAEAEVANIDLYNGQLIPAAAGYYDVVQAFKALRDASINQHLPAFTRCASRNSANGSRRRGRS